MYRTYENLRLKMFSEIGTWSNTLSFNGDYSSRIDLTCNSYVVILHLTAKLYIGTLCNLSEMCQNNYCLGKCERISVELFE